VKSNSGQLFGRTIVKRQLKIPGIDLLGAPAETAVCNVEKPGKSNMETYMPRLEVKTRIMRERVSVHVEPDPPSSASDY
jgi:hypothetical protein